MYDIIGDVHGNAGLLGKCLVRMGYRKSNNSFSHPERKAVFVGDFINRGHESRKTLHIIRSMTENGDAYAILGNHEIYAIIYSLKQSNGISIAKNDNELSYTVSNTLIEFSKYPEEWKSFRKWLRTLPLYLDFGSVRVVHACWDNSSIGLLNEALIGQRIEKSVFREIYRNPSSRIGKAVWQTTKGIDFVFPHDIRIKDNKGVFHRSFRMNWWDSPAGKTFEQISFESKFRFPDYTVPAEILPEIDPYPEDAPIVFFGHYCRRNGPHILRSNVCCLDSCIASSKVLTSYSYNGEIELDPKNLLQVK